MPHVIVKLWPGKSEEQKVRLAEGIIKYTALFLKGVSIKRMIEGKRQVLLALALVTFLSCTACSAGEPVVSGIAPERPVGCRTNGEKV